MLNTKIKLQSVCPMSNCIDNICHCYSTVTCTLLFLLSSHSAHPCPPFWNGYRIFSRHTFPASDRLEDPEASFTSHPVRQTLNLTHAHWPDVRPQMKSSEKQKLKFLKIWRKHWNGILCQQWRKREIRNLRKFKRIQLQFRKTQAKVSFLPHCQKKVLVLTETSSKGNGLIRFHTIPPHLFTSLVCLVETN